MIKGELLDYTEEISFGWGWSESKGRYGTKEELEELILFKRVVEWTKDKLVLEDGTEITIKMSESDCCAYAGGEFEVKNLDAMITDVEIGKIEKVADDRWGDVETRSVVKLFHNQNPIAQANMEAGHNGYYYSVGSLVINDIHFPVVEA